MNGADLRAIRTGLGLYQADLAAQLAGHGLKMPDGTQIDQPTISQMERGHIPVPDDVANVATGGLLRPKEPGAKPPPLPRGGKNKRRDEPAPAPEPPPAPAGVPPVEPAAAERDEARPVGPSPGPAESRGDRPPIVRADGPPQVEFTEEARSALEKDLRELLVGSSFVVPVEVATGDPEAPTRIDYHEAGLPGVCHLIAQVDPFDARVIELNAESLAKAWSDLAMQNRGVRKFLLAITYGGAWRGVIAATAPVLTSILAHHGLLPQTLFGGRQVLQQPQQRRDDGQAGPPAQPAPQPPAGGDGTVITVYPPQHG